MQRREFVRTMAAVMAAPRLLLAQKTPNPVPPPPAPVPWTTGLNAATPIPATQVADAVAQADLRFFTVTQMATLERLSDVLVPSLGDKPGAPGYKPGALAAETPAFLDFLIGSSPAPRQQLYRGGLDWLDAEAQKQFHLPFAKLEAAQADQILKPWMRSWMSDHPPTEPHADFINLAHSEIRAATINSKAWNDAPAHRAQGTTQAGLYWYPIQPDLFAEGSGRILTSLPRH